MKFVFRKNGGERSARRVALFILAIATLPFLLHAAAPSWWSQRGVLNANAPDDFAPANQGQVKNIARAAALEMDQKLVGGAGAEVHNLLAAWRNPDPATTNDFAPVNLGQLKNVAKPFYTRLIAVGAIDTYPWLKSVTPPDDFAVANIGQVKNLFGFEIPPANQVDNSRADRLAAGEYSANLAIENHAVWIWGDHLVTGSDFDRNYPRRLPELAAVKGVAAGEHHLVVLHNDGTVRTWGDNASGQLGDGTNTSRSAPTLIPTLSNIVSVKAGGLFTLALQENGTVLAWGDNYYGQLGTGDTNPSVTPSLVSGLENVSKIAAGNSRSVALKADGTVWTWGYDHYDSRDLYTLTPVQVPDLTGVLEIASGYEHTAAVKSDGSVWIWGSNDSNQLGTGGFRFGHQTSPLPVPNLPAIVKIASSYNHTLAIAADGTVWAWGANLFGQLGDGTNQPRPTPVQVVSLTDVIAISTGYCYSLAMKSDGTVWAWGESAPGLMPGLDPHLPQPVVLGLLDANRNRLDDRWELHFFGGLDQAPDADFDGDGIPNLQEFLRRTNPVDYFNGAAPVIEIAGGNNQVGDPGTFLAKPFKVRVRNSAGELLVNAPVTFTATNNSGALAATPGGPLEQTITVRTASNGEAYVYHALPDIGGISTRTNVTAGSSASGSATFRGITRVTMSVPTPTPDPSGSPTATPNPSATATATPTPKAPYRYAIVDLGKDIYPFRINNRGWLLIEGYGPSGDWGYFRWKGGTYEKLNYVANNPEFRPNDMNDAGAVVGGFSNSGSWKSGAENEINGGLFWPADQTNATKVPAHAAYRPFEPTKSGTFRSASLSAINNNNELFGQECTGTVRGFPSNTLAVFNSQIWPAATVPLSLMTAENISPQSDISNWTGTSDSIRRATATGHYIGQKFTPATGPQRFLNGVYTGMVDGQSVPFEPWCINEAGIVTGYGNSGSMIIRMPKPTSTPAATAGFLQVSIPDAGPIAINNHTLRSPTPVAMPTASGAQPSPTATPQPTPVPAPQVLSWTGAALVLWELQPDGQTWHPFGLEEMIPSIDGWTGLNPYEMNDNGLITGTGFYSDPSVPGAQSELHAFLLVPAEIMVDGNRDGEMSFDDPSARANDRTSDDRPYRFWINDDDDGAAGDPDDHVPATVLDYADGVIRSIRDLEDFARLHVDVGGFAEALEKGTVRAAFEWKEPTGDPRIKLYRAKSGTTDYLQSEATANSQLLFPFRDTLGEVTRGAPLFLSQDFWVKTSQFTNVPKTLPIAWFIFEASGEGKGELVLSFWRGNTKVSEAPGVWLDIKDVRKLYQRATAIPESLTMPYDSNSNDFDESLVSYRPEVTPRFEAPEEEDEQCLIFVHGWRPTEAEAANAAQTMFKRLWWQGFKGRFAAFRWPTKTSVFSYNSSEWLAWKYGKSLNDYVSNYVKSQIPEYTVSIAAHSMGNIVTGAALKRGMTLNKYMLMQAAIPAGCYNDSVNSYDRFLVAEAERPTPDTVTEMGYKLYLQNARENVGSFVSFFNIDDYALATGTINIIFPWWPVDANWEKNEVDFKPDRGHGGVYQYRGNGQSYFVLPSEFSERRILDRHESMSFVARPRSRAAGAEPRNAIIFGSAVDLQRACGFGRSVDDHSGQFTRPIQQLGAFYNRMVVEVKQ